MSYVVCLIYCIAVRLVLILLVYVYLFQHYCTGEFVQMSGNLVVI